MIKIIRNPKQLQTLLEKERARGRTVGFVPTMGALHAGHLSLVRASNCENEITVVSIFVNPTQFGPKEDFKKYPRTLSADQKLLKKYSVAYLFCPSVQAMYPEKYTTKVQVGFKKASFLTRQLCGKFRPGHFEGVATVVTKLLNIVGPCRLYLGAKDYQQSLVIRRLVCDLNMNVKVRVMPTIREPDGLALSSRNRYLSPAERKKAQILSQVLLRLKKNIRQKKGSLFSLKAQALHQLKTGVDRVQYLEIVDPESLEPLKNCRSKMVAAAACFVGKTRLIDNVIITPSSSL